MARTAKTNHVMSLVGERIKNNSADKAVPEQKAYPKPLAKVSNPAILHMEEGLRLEQYNKPSPIPSTLQENTEINKNENTEKTTMPKQHDSNSDSIKEKGNPGEEFKTDQSAQTLSQEYTSVIESIGAYEEDFQKIKIQIKDVKQGITAVVPDLVNQELEAIVRRFNIMPTDSNLWQITKSALETIRPEFSLNAHEYVEKSSKLRQKVILEMTKAAIRLSKNNRNS